MEPSQTTRCERRRATSRFAQGAVLQKTDRQSKAGGGAAAVLIGVRRTLYRGLGAVVYVLRAAGEVNE